MKRSVARTGASRSPHAARTPSPSSAHRTPDKGGNDVKKVLQHVRPASLCIPRLRVVLDNRNLEPCHAYSVVGGACLRKRVCVCACACHCSVCVHLLAGVWVWYSSPVLT